MARQQNTRITGGIARRVEGMTMTELKKFTKHLTAIGCAFIIANERVEVTSGYEIGRAHV